MLSLLSHPAATAFGLTLLHALWQVALVAGLVALLHTQLTSARARYATALGGLLLLPLIAVATFYASYTPVAPAASVDATQWFALLDTADAATDTTTTAATDWRTWLPYLTAAYLLGLCLFALRLAGSGLRLYFLRRRGIRPVAPRWQERMTQLNRRYAIRPRARLYLSERVNQVLSFGHFKPLILFPVGLLNQLDPTEVEAILLHELAHLQRRDYLWNWIQSAVETAYFFHPASYWLGSRIRHERECCCDDWVAQRTDKTIYAQSLIHLARFAQTPTNQLAMYANSPRSPLGQRIERLFQPAARRRSVLPLLLFLIPFALLAWQPLQETKTDEPALETLVARDDRAAEPENELLELIELAPETSPSAALPTAAVPDRQPASAYTLIPRELSFLPVTENRIPRVRLSPITPSFPTLRREISSLAAPLPAVDTVPDWSGTFHPQTLFIVDGKRLPRGSADPLDQLDPADIISVNVYKGTSAVDRFGDDTEQGVIVITTRRGNESRSRKAGVPIDAEQESEIRLRTPAGQQAEPRYVVDGEMLPEGQALEVEPNEIESITVWKGEKATERYGAAGKNGVIDIKTKTKTGPDQPTPAPDAPIHLDADQQKTKIRIRSSEQQQPLFIVDGKVQPKGAAQPADLTPEEIESVEVVKGKAAVERFGSDARDGAVLIQTKAAAKLLDKAARKEGKKLRFGPGITTGYPDAVYVIDGVIQPDARAVENLDKNDIAQVNVMKDEPARAVFGESIGDRTVVEIILKKTPPPPPPTRPASPAPVPQPAAPAAPAPPPAPTAPPVPAPQPMAAPQYLSSTLYPNPTSGATQIRFDLDREEQVVLDVFNADGRRVLNRSFGRLPAGTQQLEFDAADLPAGTYTVTILAGAQRWKATLVRP